MFIPPGSVDLNLYFPGYNVDLNVYSTGSVYFNLYFPGYNVDLNVYSTPVVLTSICISAGIMLTSMFIPPR